MGDLVKCLGCIDDTMKDAERCNFEISESDCDLFDCALDLKSCLEDLSALACEAAAEGASEAEKAKLRGLRVLRVLEKEDECVKEPTSSKDNTRAALLNGIIAVWMLLILFLQN